MKARDAGLLIGLAFAHSGARAADSPPAIPPLAIAYIAGAYPLPESLSLVGATPADAGEAGAKPAFDEIAIAGRFLGRSYAMEVIHLTADTTIARIPVGIEPEGLAVSRDGKIVVDVSGSTSMAHYRCCRPHGDRQCPCRNKASHRGVRSGRQAALGDI